MQRFGPACPYQEAKGRGSNHVLWSWRCSSLRSLSIGCPVSMLPACLKQPIPPLRRNSVSRGGEGRGPITVASGAPAVAAAVAAVRTMAAAAAAVAVKTQMWSWRSLWRTVEHWLLNSTECQTLTCGFLPGYSPASRKEKGWGATQNTLLSPAALRMPLKITTTKVLPQSLLLRKTRCRRPMRPTALFQEESSSYTSRTLT